LTYVRTPSIGARGEGTVTSTYVIDVRRTSDSAAPERWLSSASGPRARTAAIQVSAGTKEGVPEGVDASVYAVQPVCVGHALDLICAEPELQQITEGDDPVLTRAADRQRTLARSRCRKPAHSAGNIRLDLHAPIVARTSLQRERGL
jgi:hypothetical protein